MAAGKVGLKEVHVNMLKHMSLAQRRVFVIANNQLAIAGAAWDEEMLRIELAILHEEDYNLVELQRLLDARDDRARIHR
jgi:hypothetical protein